MNKKHVIALSIVSGLVITAIILCLSLLDISGVKKLSNSVMLINEKFYLGEML